MSVVEQSSLTESIQQITNNEEQTARLVELFNKHSDTDGVLNNDERKKVQVLERSLRWKYNLQKTRDTKAELDKMQRYGDKYVDHLEEDIKSLEWAIKFIKDHSK